jgi:hypothetical protein
MKTYGGVDVQIHVLLTSALAGGEWLASCTGHCTPGKRAPRHPLDRRLGGPQSQCDDVEKIPEPTGARTRTPPVVQPVASRYTDSQQQN